MRIEQLRYVVEAAETGSFTKAADNLFVKQPGLRAAVMSLEEELGYEIFERTSRGVYLTSYGEKAIPIFKNMLKEYNLLKLGMQKESTKEKSSLNISVSLAGEALFFQPSFNMMRVMYPEVKLNTLLSNMHTEQIQWLLDGKVDVAITCYSELLLADSSYQYSRLDHGYVLEQLLSKPIKIYVLDTHPLANKQRVALEDLGKYPFIFYAGGDRPIQKYLAKKIKNFKESRCLYLSYNATELPYLMQEQGMYCCLEGILLNKMSENEQYKVLDVAEPLAIEFFLAYRKNDTSSNVMIYTDIIRKLAVKM